MRQKNFVTLPDWSILPRWTIEPRYKVVGNNVERGTFNGEKEAMLWSVRATFDKATEEAKVSSLSLKKLKELLDNFINYTVMNRNSEAAMEVTIDVVSDEHADSSNGPTIVVIDPNGPVKTKGRLKVAERIKSGVEMSIASSKQKTCGFCHLKGHNTTGCPKRKNHRWRLLLPRNYGSFSCGDEGGILSISDSSCAWR
ncbi:hypothetical protein Droror1_Dr00027698 [Drosera rotundifolia]